jgi:parallel beta-helix repeat protein
MKKQLILLSATAILSMLFISSLAFSLNISSCGTLNLANTTYDLTSDVNSTATCFTLQGNSSITLDCHNYNIYFGNVSAGNGGIFIETNSNNDIIKNCNFWQLNSTISSNGIYSNRVFTNMTIINNTITLYGGGIAIYFSSGAELNASIIRNNMTTYNSNSRGISLVSNGSIVDSNIINSAGTGIYIYNSANNSIYNNIVYTSSASSPAFYLYTSTNINIVNGSYYAPNYYDIYLRTTGTTNYFYNIMPTGTTHTFYYLDNSSWLNSGSDNIILKAGIDNAPKSTSRIKNTWTQNNLNWITTASGTVTANYTITGLLPITVYTVYNNSVLRYTFITDSSGNSPYFNITLTTSPQTIIVNSTAYIPPITTTTTTTTTTSTTTTTTILNTYYSYYCLGNISYENKTGVLNSIQCQYGCSDSNPITYYQNRIPQGDLCSQDSFIINLYMLSIVMGFAILILSMTWIGRKYRKQILIPILFSILIIASIPLILFSIPSIFNETQLGIIQSMLASFSVLGILIMLFS